MALNLNRGLYAAEQMTRRRLFFTLTGLVLAIPGWTAV
jgi:hypothetical protein